MYSGIKIIVIYSSTYHINNTYFGIKDDNFFHHYKPLKTNGPCRDLENQDNLETFRESSKDLSRIEYVLFRL